MTQYQINLQKLPKTLKNCHSGEISPSLVTLVRLYTIHTSVFTSHQWLRVPFLLVYLLVLYSFQLLFYDYLSLGLLDTFYVADFSW